MTVRAAVRPMRSISGRDFEEVEFSRDWKAFDFFAGDFIAGTNALPPGVVGIYARLRAALWVFGSGWVHSATLEEWCVHAGTKNVRELRAAYAPLVSRGLVLIDEVGPLMTIADPAIYRDLLRKERERRRKSHRSSGGSPAGTRKEEGGRRNGDHSRVERAEDVPGNDDVIAVLAHYRSRPKLRGVDPSRAAWTAARRRLVAERLAEGRTVEELCRSIDGHWESPFHRGELPGHPTARLTLELILRDAQHVEAGLAYLERAPAAAAEPELPDLRDLVGSRRAPERGEAS